MRRVLLFGLSADPPTGEGGHLGLVRWAAAGGGEAELGGALDALWIIPVFRHAYTEKSDLAPFEDRVEMCRLAFSRVPGPATLEISEIERELARKRGESDPPLGTLDVIEALEARHPSVRFGLLLGADTARDLREGKWRRSEALLARVPLVVAPRAGVEGVPEVAEGAPELAEVSSSAARAAAPDPARLRALVPEEVAAYIESRGLYGASRGGGGRPPSR